MMAPEYYSCSARRVGSWFSAFLKHAIFSETLLLVVEILLFLVITMKRMKEGGLLVLVLFL
jgi:hypothetical protein